ncbi:MAG: Hsp70 family protein [Spirochaetaceae bacterium]|jgi:molecular chaperone DnaK|nr:Hsp70 family protein [Spirochaetaceae bacterium]
MKAGIDFGTSTSEIAYVDDNGKIVIVPNHLGETITPSVVYIDEGGAPVIGLEAKEKALIEPENTFLEVKRLFGQNTELQARNKSYSPVETAAMIIRYLTDCARKHSGQTIDSVVITVPAYFTDSQRKDVLAAGKAAGLEVERIINEPTAASLDYGIEHMRDCDYILVYDLGGGTLDVTVLELFEGVVEVKSSCGNNTLGGKDFDQEIMNHITGIIKKRDKADVTSDARAMMRIKIAAEQGKIALSSKTENTIELPFLYSKDGNPVGYSEKITRSAFESMIREKIYSTEQQIKTALFDAELTAQDIDLTLLVGGSTRIPLVSQFLSEIFGITPEAAVDPDLAVVRGAAIQAGVLSGVLKENAIVLTDICPYSLSTEALMDLGFGNKETFCDIIIKRNTTLPTAASKMYSTSRDYQTKVHVTAYQGESIDPDENYLLNSFELSGIPKAKANKEKINIRFEYDLNGILTVQAEIISTGKSASVTVNTAQMGKNLDLSKWKENPAARQYRQIINKAERLIKVHGEDKSENVEAAANELKKALVMNWDVPIIEKFKFHLDDAIDDLEEENK